MTFDRPWPLLIVALFHRTLHRLTGGRLGDVSRPAAPRGKTLARISSIHTKLYRWTGGLVGWSTAGMPTLLLTTTGRKTGLARTVPLPYIEWEGTLAVIASYAASPTNPAWYDNLVAKPEVEVQVKRRRYKAIANTALPAERPAVWAAITARWANYADYQRATTREIPVVFLRETEAP